jgi:hypothetical protein
VVWRLLRRRRTVVTAGTPATTEPVAYVDRDGEVWTTAPLAQGDNPPVPLLIWEHFTMPLAVVEANHGPLTSLVREDVVAAREAAARDEGRAERSEGFRRLLAAAGISDHEGGGGDTRYDRPAAHMLEELVAWRDTCQRDAAYWRDEYEQHEAEVARLRAEVAAAEQRVYAAVDAEIQDAPDPNYEENDYAAGYIAGLTWVQKFIGTPGARADAVADPDPAHDPRPIDMGWMSLPSNLTGERPDTAAHGPDPADG